MKTAVLAAAAVCAFPLWTLQPTVLELGPGCYPVCAPDGSDQGAICCTMDKGGESFETCRSALATGCKANNKTDPAGVCQQLGELRQGPCGVLVSQR